MKKFELNINNCFECPNLQISELDRKDSRYCSKNPNESLCLGGQIPNWCPLPDLKEKICSDCGNNIEEPR